MHRAQWQEEYFRKYVTFLVGNDEITLKQVLVWLEQTVLEAVGWEMRTENWHCP